MNRAVSNSTQSHSNDVEKALENPQMAQTVEDIKYIQTSADESVSFIQLKAKTWGEIDISQYKPIDINKKINDIINVGSNTFDESLMTMPISEWIMPLFIKLFHTTPNKLMIDASVINTNSFINDLLKEFKLENKIHTVSNMDFIDDTDHISANNFTILFGLDEFGLLIYKSHETVYILYSPTYYLDDTHNYKLKSLFSVAKSYSKNRVQKNHISIIYNDGHGLTKNRFQLKEREINLEENYNDDFVKVSNDLIKKLNDSEKTGLFILHGEHGTGKTTYIRHLASVLKREVIFIPPDMVDLITSPNFIGFLMNNPDSVLIIEDGESAIQQRDNMRTNGVANILNMTDGLLSDCLNISIVVTFNTKTKNLDEALLRKGRLMKRYEFGKLSTEKSQKLLDKLGIEKKATAPMRLSDIYYADDENQSEEFSNKKQVKGFNR